MSARGMSAQRSSSQPARGWRVPVWILVPLGATAVALFFISGGIREQQAFTQWYVWSALIAPIVWIDRRLPMRSDALGVRAALHVPLSVWWTYVYLALAAAVTSIIGDGTGLHWPSMAAVMTTLRRGSIHWNILYYWLIVGGIFAVDYHRQSRERQQRTTELERLLAEAQLSALRAQLHPHFLFNALNTISAEVERQPKVARRMLEHLGELLRLSLEQARPDTVTLTDELEMLEHYLAIQRARFAGRLDIQVDIDPAARDALVPGLLLQPLVENAIRHGLAPRVQQGRLRVAARARQDRLHLTVDDDGVGLPAGWALDRDAGIGLSTTRRRLEALYGGASAFTVREGAMGGVTVDVSLPFQRVTAPADTSVPSAAVAVQES